MSSTHTPQARHRVLDAGAVCPGAGWRRLWIGLLAAPALLAAAGCSRSAPTREPATPAPEQPSTGAPASKTAASATPAKDVQPGAPAKAALESPFPGGKREAHQPAPGAVRAAQAGSPDRIPGVPSLALPAPSRSPFRSQDAFEAKAGPGRATPRTARGAAPAPGPKAGQTMRGWPPVPPALTPPFPFGVAPSGADRSPAGRREQPGERAPGAATPGAPGSPAPDAPARLLLTAVIMGAPPMAVIEGDSAHYIVQPGDAVGSGYRVAIISLERVVLRASGRPDIVLRLRASSG